MIFSFLSGVSLGAILLGMESAPLLEDDDVSLSSAATVLIKTFYCTQKNNHVWQFSRSH